MTEAEAAELETRVDQMEARLGELDDLVRDRLAKVDAIEVRLRIAAGALMAGPLTGSPPDTPT